VVDECIFTMTEPGNPLARLIFKYTVGSIGPDANGYVKKLYQQKCTSRTTPEKQVLEVVDGVQQYFNGVTPEISSKPWVLPGARQLNADRCPVFCSGVEAAGKYGVDPKLDGDGELINTGKSYCEENLGGVVEDHDWGDNLKYLTGQFIP